MATLRGLGLGLASVLASIVATGCSDGSGNGAGAPSTGGALRSEIARTVCREMVPCCERSGIPLVKDGCEERVKRLYRQDYGPDAGALDPALASECISIIVAQVRQCSGASSANTMDACERLTKPPVPGFEHGHEGDACWQTCPLAAACTPLGPNDGSKTCYPVDGFYCDASLHCVKRLPVGSRCATDGECESSYCASATSMCTARGSAGESCDPAGRSCVPGVTCIERGSDNVCMQLLARGAPCTSDDQCGGTCNADGRCEGSVSFVTQVCTAPAP